MTDERQDDDPTRSALNPILQFRRNGLDPPIVLKANYRLALGCGALWLLACVFAIAMADEIIVQGAGILGMAFLVLVSPYFLPALFRRGSLIFSNEGVYHGYYNLRFEWCDVGPAWISTHSVRGTPVSVVVFLVRRASFYRTQVRWFKRPLFARQSAKSKSFYRANVANPSNLLEEIRKRTAADPDALVLTIPKVIRAGLSDVGAVEIINSVLLQRAKASDVERNDDQSISAGPSPPAEN